MMRQGRALKGDIKGSARIAPIAVNLVIRTLLRWYANALMCPENLVVIEFVVKC